MELLSSRPTTHVGSEAQQSHLLKNQRCVLGLLGNKIIIFSLVSKASLIFKCVCLIALSSLSTGFLHPPTHPSRNMVFVNGLSHSNFILTFSNFQKHQIGEEGGCEWQPTLNAWAVTYSLWREWEIEWLGSSPAWSGKWKSVSNTMKNVYPIQYNK